MRNAPGVGVLELLAGPLGRAEVELGGDARPAQLPGHRRRSRRQGGVHVGDQHLGGGLLRPVRPRWISAASRRSTPIEAPAAGTSSPRKRITRSS